MCGRERLTSFIGCSSSWHSPLPRRLSNSGITLKPRRDSIITATSSVRSFVCAAGDSLRLRPVVDPLRMQRQHSGLNSRATEEISLVVEECFVIVHVAVIKRDTECGWIAFQRSWCEGGNQQSPGLKGHMYTGGEVVTRTGHRTKIPHVQFRHPQVAFPACDVHGIERIKDTRIVPIPLDAYFPFTSM